MADYYTLPTEIGQAKLASAQAGGPAVALAELAVGDGGGVVYDPVASQTALTNEVARVSLSQLYTHPNNPNWVVTEGIIAADVGGWYVREAGIFDSAGDMIYIIKYPETYKPVLAEGSTRDLVIRPIMAVADASNVTLVIDPAVAAASQDYVDTTFVKKAGDTMTGALDILGMLLGDWNNTNHSDIYSLLSGSVSGSFLQPAVNGHCVLGLRDNDGADSFAIVATGGDWDVDGVYDVLVARFYGNGNVDLAPSGQLTGPTPAAGSNDTQVATTAFVLQALLDGVGLGKSLGANGYTTLPGGMILQWGKTTTLTQEGEQTITLPIVWPNAGLVAHATPIRSNSVLNATVAAGATLVSNNQITLVLDAYNSAGSSGVYWFAIGS